MTVLPYELETVVQEMHNARRAKLYYPCLLVALTLPEICSGLILPKNKFVKDHHYISFVDSYSSPGELGGDGLSLYRLRGGLVHRGDLRGHPHADWTHVIISIPESKGLLHQCSAIGGGKSAWMLDLDMLVDAMDVAVRRWYEANRENEMLTENLPFLIRYSPEGLAPFVIGNAAIVSGV